MVSTIAHHIQHAVLEVDMVVRAHDEHAIIELVGNTRIAIRQAHRIRRQGSRITSRLRIREVLEHDLPLHNHKCVTISILPCLLERKRRSKY